MKRRNFLLAGAALAGFGLAGPARANRQPTPADKAFRFHVARVKEGLKLSWATLPGYYLYRDSFEAKTADGQTVALDIPKGETKDDPNFGMVEVFHDGVDILVPSGALPAQGRLHVTYQGCAESGFCYVPVAKTVDLVSLAVAEDSGRP